MFTCNADAVGLKIDRVHLEGFPTSERSTCFSETSRSSVSFTSSDVVRCRTNKIETEEPLGNADHYHGESIDRRSSRGLAYDDTDMARLRLRWAGPACNPGSKQGYDVDQAV